MLVRGRQTPSRRFTRSEILAVEGRPRRRIVRARGQGRGGPGGRARFSRSGWRARPACLPPAAPSDPRVRSDARQRAPEGSNTRSGAGSPACRFLSAARSRTGPALAPGPTAMDRRGTAGRRGRGAAAGVPARASVPDPRFGSSRGAPAPRCAARTGGFCRSPASVLVLHPAVPDPRIHETGYRVGAWRWPRGRFLYGAKSPFFSWTRSPASTPYCETGDSSGERAL